MFTEYLSARASSNSQGSPQCVDAAQAAALVCRASCPAAAPSPSSMEAVSISGSLHVTILPVLPSRITLPLLPVPIHWLRSV